MNKRTNKQMNKGTYERKDENYIPLGINVGSIIKRIANLYHQSFEHNCQFYMGTLEKLIVCFYAVNHNVNKVM